MPKSLDFHHKDNRGRVGDGDDIQNMDGSISPTLNNRLATPAEFEEHPELSGLLGQLQAPEPIVPTKIEQNDYNIIVEHARAHGKAFINIPKGAITEHLNLAMDIPHNFNGFNLIGDVPDGSFVGDGSEIASDKTLNDCDLGYGVIIGPFVKLNNCRVGAGCKAGEGLEINGTEIQMMFEAENVFASNSVIMGMCDINKLTVAGDCVVYPGLHTESFEVYGERNVIGDVDLKIPENAHPSNTYLEPDFTGSTVYNFMPVFKEAKDGRLPSHTSVRGELKQFIDKAIEQHVEQVHGLDDDPRHRGPGM